MERYLIRRGLNRLILLPILLSVVYAGVALWQLTRMLDERDWVLHTTSVLTQSMDVERHLAIQVATLRGFVLTQDSDFRNRFYEEDSIVERQFQALHETIRDNPRQTARLDSILERYWTWQSLALHSLKSPGTTPQLVTELRKRAEMIVGVRDLFDSFQATERSLYDAREARFNKVTLTLAITIGILSILLGVVIGAYARRQANVFIRRFTEAIDESSQSRDLLKTTLMSIGDAIIVTDQFRTVNLMNARAEELTGWTLPEAQGRRIDDVFHVADEQSMKTLENPVTTVMKEQRPVELRQHAVLLSRKGVEFPIEDSAAPIRNSRRQIVGVALVFRDITSRRENERESEQREREFRALIENAPDVILRYARDLTITYVNPAIEHMLGISPTALIGRRFKDVGIPEEVYFPWERAVQDVFTKQHSISTEIQYQTLHGIRRYQARLVPETDENDIQSVISIARDITEIKQTEYKLRQSEQRFRGIIENMPDAFFLVSAVRDGAGIIVDFRFEYVNEKGAELITVPPEKCIGRRLLEVMPGPSPERYVKRYARILESGKPQSEEYKITTPYLRAASWLRSQYVPIGDTLAITSEDITEHKQIAEALEQSEHRYRHLVDSAREAIFSTDATGKFTYANPYIREISGYTEEEALTFNFIDLVPEDYKAVVRRHFFRQFLSKTPASFFEAPFVTKSGESLWLSITSALRMNGEAVEGFDCIATDLTEHHDREIQLEAARSQAEHVMRESQQRMEQVRSMAIPTLESIRSALSKQDAAIPTDERESLLARLDVLIERLS